MEMMQEKDGKPLFYSMFDTHAHYADPVYTDTLPIVLDKIQKCGVTGALIPGTTLSDSEQACALAETYPFVYAAVGVHPLFIERNMNSHEPLSEMINSLKELICKHRVTAIGEIGLDYRSCKNDTSAIALQKEYFDAQLSLCEEYRLPALIHSVDAAADTLERIKAHPDVKGVLHGFSYSAEVAEQAYRLGWYIGIGTFVLNPNARKICEVIRRLPADSLLIETDCPYQPKNPSSSSPSDSSLLAEIIKKSADLRKEDPLILCKQITENTSALFHL